MKEKKMNNDWRLTNQIDYLYGKKLTFARFEPKPASDHEHCDFCWAKFGNGNEMLHSGYYTTTTTGVCWICEDCFNDFKDQFNWTVEEGKT